MGGGWRLLAGDVWETWRGHPGRMAPVGVALWSGLTALMALSCVWGALSREADRIAREWGADGFAVRWTGPEEDGGWAPWEVERFGSAVGDAGWVGGEGEGTECEAFGERVRVAGMSGAFAESRDWSWRPRPPDALDLHSGRRVLWLPAAAAERWGVAPGQTVDAGGTAWAVEGVFAGGGDAGDGGMLWGGAEAVGEWSGTAGGRARVLRVRSREGAGNGEARRRLAAALGGSEVEWATPERALARLGRWRRVWGGALGWGGGLSLLLAVSGMASLQWMAVRERVREIGLRRAMGARPADVAALFLAEAAALTALAALAAAVSLGAVAAWMDRCTPLEVRVGWRDVAAPAVAVLSVALLAALGPARAAARMDPAESLRDAAGGE